MLAMRVPSPQDASRVDPRSLLGTRSANFSGIVVINPHPTEDFIRAPAAFHIVIPTTGEVPSPVPSPWCLCGHSINVCCCALLKPR